MVAPRSFLSPTTVTTIAQLTRAGFATKHALQGGPSITLERQRADTGEWEAVSSVAVVFDTTSRQQARDVVSGAAAGSERENTVSALAPWDVQKGDQFTIDGATATITYRDPIAPQIQLAWYVVGTGALA